MDLTWRWDRYVSPADPGIPGGTPKLPHRGNPHGWTSVADRVFAAMGFGDAPETPDPEDATAPVVVHTVTLPCGCKVPTADVLARGHDCPKAVAHVA